MRLEGIQTGDIVEVDHGGRCFHAVVTGAAPGGLAIQPTDRRVRVLGEGGAGWVGAGRVRA